MAHADPIRVLVTGASGCIGRAAVTALRSAGATVFATSRSGTGHRADLLDPAARQGLLAEASATHLLHLAWITDHGAYWTSRENIIWLAASADLLAHFAAAGGRRAVGAGSCAEYDWRSLPPGPIDEAAPIDPQTAYGACKAGLHHIGVAMAGAGGFGYAWGRIFHTYGAGENENRLVAHVARALAAGREAKCGPGAYLRDYMDFRDVGSAFAALVISDVEGPVNIASGEGTTVDSVVATLESIAGSRGRIETGALSRYDTAPAALVADTGRLRDEVGFAPTISLARGLADAYAYWRGDTGTSSGEN